QRDPLDRPGQRAGGGGGDLAGLEALVPGLDRPKGGANMTESGHVLGRSEQEIRQLIRQSALLRPITERLLRGAGIRRGMRVLDLGCGAGAVSLLAAELVGRSGSVVGIDRNPDVLGVARRRAWLSGLPQVEFREAWAEGFSDPGPFDLAVGRFVL